MATDAQRNSCQVRVLTQGYTHPQWLGALGHVSSEKHSYAYPGGCDQASCTLTMTGGVLSRNSALNPGNIYEVWKGCSKIWEGILDEPSPNTTGWSITAHGNGTYGNSYMADYPTRGGGSSTPADSGCTTTKGSSTVHDTHVVAADLGSIVGGNTIPGGSIISSVTPGTSFTISAPSGASAVATATATINVEVSGWTLDAVLNASISRGMRWTKPTFGLQGWLQTQEDIASITTTDFLNNATIQAGLLWYVDVHQNNLLTIGAPPSTVNRLLICQVPNPRTLGASLSRLYYKYVSAVNGSNQTYSWGYVNSAAAEAQFGNGEQYADFTANSAGAMTSAQAAVNAQAILNQYITAMYGGTYQAMSGQLLTTGGSPVDPASEPAGNVYRLLLTDGSFGGNVVAGPVTFVGGNVEWDDDALVASITPYQSYRTNVGTLMTKQMPQLRM
jgi:hypothetical protein